MNAFFKFFEKMLPFGVPSMPSAPTPKPARKPRAKKPASATKKKPAPKKK